MNTLNIEQIDWKNQLIELFEQKSRHFLSSSKIQNLRNEAFGCFAELKFPTTKHEEWKYTNPNAFLKQAFAFDAQTNVSEVQVNDCLVSELAGIRLVFINGVFSAKYSQIDALPKGLTILPLAEVLEKNPSVLEPYFAKHINFHQEVFTAMNTAFAENGIFIQVAKNQVIDTPIILHFISDAQAENTASQPHNIFIAEPSSQATLIEKYDTIGSKVSFTNLVNEVFVAENAHLSHYRIQHESEKAYHIATTQVQQTTNSCYTNVTISLNAALIRNNLNIRLDGQNIETNMYGLYMLAGNTLVDNHSIADHLQPNSVSNELYKGILDGKSSGVFNGKIYVRPDAQKTNAYQQNRNVILSDTAGVNTKPQLEIWADDVKCSHGATTGSLDETALFYLRARGIPKSEARALLVHAFAYEIIEKIQSEALRHFLDELVLRRLGA